MFSHCRLQGELGARSQGSYAVLACSCDPGPVGCTGSVCVCAFGSLRAPTHQRVAVRRQASTASSQQTSSKSSSLQVSVDSAEAAAAAAAATEVRVLSERLVDQELRPEDIQLEEGPDGTPLLLGKGGFGEVRLLQRCSGRPGGGQGRRQEELLLRRQGDFARVLFLPTLRPGSLQPCPVCC